MCVRACVCVYTERIAELLLVKLLGCLHYNILQKYLLQKWFKYFNWAKSKQDVLAFIFLTSKPVIAPGIPQSEIFVNMSKWKLTNV